MEDRDEIRLIEKTVQRITRESEEMKSAVSQQYPVMRNNLLIGLMAGTQDVAEVCEKLKTLDIVFAEPNFVSLLLDLEIDETAESGVQQERLLAYAAITNISHDLMDTADGNFWVFGFTFRGGDLPGCPKVSFHHEKPGGHVKAAYGEAF